MALSGVFHWFSGGQPGYSTLHCCMNGDLLWIALTVILDFAVAFGYVLIALHWRSNEKRIADGPPKRALGSMKNIFIFCGICGYLFIPIKMVWPAWRLYDLVLIVLVYFTWKYAWSARDLKVIYNELGRSAELAQDLERSRAESRRKSFFLNAVSHDLRTPLNSLGLHAELAEIHIDANDRAGLRESLAEIRSGARAAADLLNYFLELGRLDWSEDTVQLTPFELNEVLQETRDVTQALADRKKLTLRLEAPDGLVVLTDRAKLGRILLNLVTNGLKFTQDGSVAVTAEAVGSDVTIVVSDTGPGIAAEHQARIFDEFFQVQNGERDRTKGFGLGLSIARRLALQLNGNLSLESEPGRGCQFTLQLRGALARDRARIGRVEPALPV